MSDDVNIFALTVWLLDPETRKPTVERMGCQHVTFVGEGNWIEVIGVRDGTKFVKTYNQLEVMAFKTELEPGA